MTYMRSVQRCLMMVCVLALLCSCCCGDALRVMDDSHLAAVRGGGLPQGKNCVAHGYCVSTQACDYWPDAAEPVECRATTTDGCMKTWWCEGPQAAPNCAYPYTRLCGKHMWGPLQAGKCAQNEAYCPNGPIAHYRASCRQ